MRFKEDEKTTLGSFTKEIVNWQRHLKGERIYLGTSSTRTWPDRSASNGNTSNADEMPTESFKAAGKEVANANISTSGLDSWKWSVSTYMGLKTGDI